MAVRQQLRHIRTGLTAVVQCHGIFEDILGKIFDALRGGLGVHEGGILPPVGTGGGDLHQLRHVIAVLAADPVPNCQGIHRLSVPEQLPSRLEDQPVGRVQKILGVYHGHHFSDEALIDQQGANHTAFGVQLVVQPVFMAHCCHP